MAVYYAASCFFFELSLVSLPEGGVIDEGTPCTDDSIWLSLDSSEFTLAVSDKRGAAAASGCVECLLGDGACTGTGDGVLL